MLFNHLILQITDHCPLQCAHCCVESGPWRTTAMALDDAVSYVRQAWQMNPQVRLSFTGGEPFTRYPLMRDIARTSHDLGLEFSVVTSAVWCKSADFAREKLTELRSLGLSLLSVSHDSFHQPWVTTDKVENLLTAARDLGLPVLVAGAVTAGSRGAEELLGDLLAGFPEARAYDGPVAPNGRAALIPLDSLLYNEWGDNLPACPQGSDLIIQPDGATYPCCTTGGDYAFLHLGNARQTPLAELRATAERQSWFRIITRDGFGALERIVRQYHPEVRFPRRSVGECDLCKLVFGPGELSAVVRDSLARFDADSERLTAGIWQQVAAAVRGVTAAAPGGDSD